MERYHLQQTHLPSLPHSLPRPFSPPNTLFPVRARTRNPKLRLGVSATARLATEPKSTMYDLLSVSETAGLEEIKAAYRKVARQWHPDTCRSEDKEFSTQQFIKAREAYKVLSDPVLREEYDYGLQGGFGVDGVLFGRKSGAFGDWELQMEGLNLRSGSSCRNSSWGSRMRAKRDQVS